MNPSPVSKAIAGGLVTMLASYLLKYGFTLDPQAADAVTVLVNLLVTYIVGYIGVYIAPKNTNS